MMWEPIIFCGALLLVAAPQSVDQEECNTVERKCEKFIWVEKIPIKNSAAKYTEKQGPIKKAEVCWYRSLNEASCCGTGLPIAKALTSKNGEFEFKVNAISAGNSWLRVELNVKQYSHAIRYEKAKTEVSCSDLRCDRKKGELELTRIIHVD